MPLTQIKRFTTKEKEKSGEDPYSMKGAPKGLLECPDCHATYFRKRWSFPGRPTTGTRAGGARAAFPKKPTKEFMIPQEYVCPACRKLRDGYAEGYLTIHWPNWDQHKAEVLGLIHNEEARAARNNALERIMTIRTRPDGADIETTTDHFAQSLGKHLNRAFKGKVRYRWGHREKLARIEWHASPPAKKRNT